MGFKFDLYDVKVIDGEISRVNIYRYLSIAFRRLEDLAAIRDYEFLSDLLFLKLLCNVLFDLSFLSGRTYDRILAYFLDLLDRFERRC